MKVIFLDFDGVLNSLRSPAEGVNLVPEKLKLLKRLVDATGASIVLSTSWREHWGPDGDATGAVMDQMFHDHGLQIDDKTPTLPQGREAEIKAWLDQHPQVNNFVVLDDRLLAAEYLQGHFVKVSSYFGGLAEVDVYEAIRILEEVTHIG